MSLREWLWDTVYATDGALMQDSVVGAELVGALLMAGMILVLCWFGMRKLFFRIAQSANVSRKATLVFGGCFILAWLLGALEGAGVNSVQWMLILMILSTAGTFTYLMWVKNR